VILSARKVPQWPAWWRDLCWALLGDVVGVGAGEFGEFSPAVVGGGRVGQVAGSVLLLKLGCLLVDV
jgi:hypothetical protein